MSSFESNYEAVDYSLISPSRMNDFYTCSMKWYYDKIKIEPIIQTDTFFLDLGTLIHELVEKYYKAIRMKMNGNNGKVTPGMIQDCFHDIINNNIELREQTSMTDSIEKGFIDLEKKRLKTLKQYIPDLVEKKIITDKYIGIIDRYYKEDGIIDDVKTGSYIDMEKLKTQGKIYEVLLRSKGYTVNRIQASFIKLGKVVNIPIMSDDWLERKYTFMVDKIEKQAYTKKQGSHCRYCPHKIRCLIPYTLKEVCELY